ncbi:MAG TPA: hypothetical protein VH914_18940 [Acidimicrobiia bacterium]|nr:hypothetical protein [Acidimicrobiia bacterium]
MDKAKPTTAEWTIMGAAAVMLIGSFLGYYSHAPSAWGTGLFPIATLPVLYGIVMGAHIALTRFAGSPLPDRVGGFTWEQLHLVLGIFAVLLTLFFLATDNPGLGAGAVIDFIAAIALAVGAVRLQQERNTGAVR